MINLCRGHTRGGGVYSSMIQTLTCPCTHLGRHGGRQVRLNMHLAAQVSLLQAPPKCPRDTYV
jgi:hypothetical protein